MMDNHTTKPIILVDLKKDRIRINRNTLHDIGNPEYIFLLVNPEKLTLALLRSNHFNVRAHRVSIEAKAVELYSKPLIKSLCVVCSNLQNEISYRLFGQIVPNEGIAMFFIPEAVPVEGKR